MPSVSSSHHNLLHLTKALAAPPPIPILLRTAELFLQAQTAPLLALATTGTTKSAVLLQVIAALDG